MPRANHPDVDLPEAAGGRPSHDLSDAQHPSWFWQRPFPNWKLIVAGRNHPDAWARWPPSMAGSCRRSAGDMPACVWGYALVWFFINNAAKIAVYRLEAPRPALARCALVAADQASTARRRRTSDKVSIAAVEEATLESVWFLGRPSSGEAFMDDMPGTGMIPPAEHREPVPPALKRRQVGPPPIGNALEFYDFIDLRLLRHPDRPRLFPGAVGLWQPDGCRWRPSAPAS